MKLYVILIIAIPLQFLAAYLALRLVRVTKKAAWAFIAIAILLMALRRCAYPETFYPPASGPEHPAGVG